MDLTKESLLHNFKTLKNHCSILDPAVIKEYFPDGHFESALNKFFDVEFGDVESFYSLDYPFQGEIVFSENKFIELVEVIPEFIVSLIKVGMPLIVSLHKYQRSRKSEPVLLSLPNLVESSKIVYHSWNLLGDLLQQGTKERQSSIAELESKLDQLVRTKPHYDLLGTLQNVYNSIVLMAISEDILEQGLFDLFIHPDKEKRDTLYSLAGRELTSLRTLNSITGKDGIDNIILRIRQDLIQNGYPQLNQPLKRESALPITVENTTEYVFRLNGEFWEIKYGSKSKNIKDSKGMLYIHILLEKTAQPIRADVLVSANEKSEIAEGLIIPSEEYSSANQVEDSSEGYERKIQDYSNEVQERDSHAEYKLFKEQLAALKSELHMIDPDDPGYPKKEKEYQDFRKFISRTYNIRGQARQSSGGGDQARQAVFKAIARAQEKIAKYFPELETHFEEYLTTGFECKYDPPPSQLPDWQL